METQPIRFRWPELRHFVVKEIEKCHFEIINRFAQKEKYNQNSDARCLQKYHALERRNTDPECSLDEKEIAKLTRVQILLQELIERTRQQHLYAAYKIEDELTPSLRHKNSEENYEQITTFLHTKLPF